MSRGLGKLQRAILAELEKRENWTTAYELTMATQPGGPRILAREGGTTYYDTSSVHQVSVRRALHSLHRRGLVKLAHQRLAAWDSEIVGGLFQMPAEHLCAWLPDRPGPKPFPGEAIRLNPKRCVPRTAQTTQHLEQRDQA